MLCDSPWNRISPHIRSPNSVNRCSTFKPLGVPDSNALIWVPQLIAFCFSASARLTLAFTHQSEVSSALAFSSLFLILLHGAQRPRRFRLSSQPHQAHRFALRKLCTQSFVCTLLCRSNSSICC